MGEGEVKGASADAVAKAWYDSQASDRTTDASMEVYREAVAAKVTMERRKERIQIIGTLAVLVVIWMFGACVGFITAGLF